MGSRLVYAPPQQQYGQSYQQAPQQQPYNPYGQQPAPAPYQQPAIHLLPNLTSRDKLPDTVCLIPIPSATPAATYGAPATALYGAHSATAVNGSVAMYGQVGVPSAPAPASRVLKMSNMVTLEEIQDDSEYADIMEDVRLECSDHGAVLRVLHPPAKGELPAHAEGNIYVEFSDATGASAAKQSLVGRKFDNRTVIVEDYPETSYRQGIF